MLSKFQITDPLRYDLLDVERFAFEVLVYSAAKFGVPQSCIPQWRGRDIHFEHRHLVHSLSRIVFKYQITQRKAWSCEFNTYFLLHGFRSWRDTQFVLCEMYRVSIKSVGCIRHKMLIGFAVMNEFLLFLYSKNYILHVEELAKFQAWYMSTDWPELEKYRKYGEKFKKSAEYLSIYQRRAGHWKEFEKVGGLGEICKRLLDPKFASVDAFYNEFIPEFCIPYHNEDELPHLSYTFYDKSVSFFRKMTKHLSRNKRREYSDVFNTTVWRDCRTSPRIDLIGGYVPRLGYCTPWSPEVFLSAVYKIPKSELWKLKPENAGPLLPRYDRWLLDRGVDMEFEGYVRSFQYLPNTSQQADGSQRISPGHERGQKTRSSLSTPHTGPSETVPFSWKSETFFHPGSNPDAEESRQEREEHRRQLSSEGAIRKSNFAIFKLYSRKDYFSEHNLKPLETKSSEESVQDADLSVVDTATSSQNRPGKRRKAGDGKGSNSPQQQELRLSSSTLSLEKGIAQYNLDPSETISSSPKPENIGLETRSSEESVRDADVSVVDAATSPQSRPGTSPKEVGGDGKGSIGPEEPTHVENSQQLNLGFSSWNFNSETFFHPGSNPDAEASRQEKEGHRRRLSSEGAIRKMGYTSYSRGDQFSEQHSKPLKTKTRRRSVRDVVDAATSSQNRPVASLEATDLDASVVDAATSSQNRPGAKPEEATDRKESISPDSVLAAGFAQINLCPSETESSNEESN